MSDDGRTGDVVFLTRTCVSLFSGIGGLDLGLARAGFRHLAFCEGGGDPNGTKAEREQWASGVYRRSVLRARWPGVPVYEDVRDVAGDGDARFNERRPRRERGRDGARAAVDLLCGGFPCQDLSVAGQRRGLMHEGGRSNLFFEFARIAESLRPRWLLVENVPGLLSSQGGRDFGTVLGTLADIGYGVAWRVLDSRFFGVPQRRRRVFIVGALAVGDPRAAAERAGEILAVGSRCPGHPATRGEARQDLAGSLGGGSGERGWAQDTERMTFVPVTQSLTKQPRYNDNDAQGGFHIAASDGGSVRRLMPVECERLQALPDSWTDLGGTADSKRYAALGDAVTASVSEWIGRRLVEHDKAGSAEARGHDSEERKP